MKILYLECNMGIAGDMLMAALWQLTKDKKAALDSIMEMGLPKTEITFEEKSSCGIIGTYARVICNGEIEGEHNHHSHGKGFTDIAEVINSLNINESVKQMSLNSYRIIADAESKVHGKKIDEIHFHEVGTLDAIADIVVSSYLLDLLGVDKIVCSPVNVGGGSVKCAHGILPVPAPATAEILKGIPFYSGEIKSELCTPTGAALIRANADEFGTMPKMICNEIGYGFGKKDFNTANCVRAFLGVADNEDRAIELACNIDDMTAEALAFACEALRKNGALDVTQTAINMKKSRLGTMLSVICKSSDREKMLKLIFKHTSTIGVREYQLNRYTLKRDILKINTPYGTVRSKYSQGYDVKKAKLEYDDIERIAMNNDLSIDEVIKLI